MSIDPFFELRHSNPVPELLDANAVDFDEVLLEEILGGPSFPKRKRRLLFIVPTIVVLAAACSLGYALLRHSAIPAVVTCLPEGETGPWVLVSSKDECASLMSIPVTQVADCTLNKAHVVVRLVGDDCETNGFGDYETSAGDTAIASTIERIKVRLGKIGTPSCVTNMGTAEKIGTTELRRGGLDVWRVEVVDDPDFPRGCITVGDTTSGEAITLLRTPITPNTTTNRK